MLYACSYQSISGHCSGCPQVESISSYHFYCPLLSMIIVGSVEAWLSLGLSIALDATACCSVLLDCWLQIHNRHFAFPRSSKQTDPTIKLYSTYSLQELRMFCDFCTRLERFDTQSTWFLPHIYRLALGMGHEAFLDCNFDEVFPHPFPFSWCLVLDVLRYSCCFFAGFSAKFY